MALEQLSDVVQKCQAVQDDSYTAEDYDVFTIAGRACIEEGNSAQVLSIVVDEKNKDLVRCMGWNLLPPLIQILLKKEDKNLSHCLAILQYLLEACSPKELLVGLLEQVEEVHLDTIEETFQLLLNPLQKVLLRLGSRKASSLGMVLSTLLEQVAKLPVPQTKEVSPLCRCCLLLMNFVRPFVHEAKQNLVCSKAEEESPHQIGKSGDRTLSDKEDELRTELLKFCMKSLFEPLLKVQLSEPDILPVSPLRTFATEILSTLTAIGESLPNLVFHPLSKRKEVPGFLEEEVRYPKHALASLAHLLFVHHLAMDNFPAVFSPVFVLRCNMEHVNLLLSRTEELWIQKGLELYEKSLLRTEDGSLSVYLLEIKVFISVPQNLVHVMTLCPELHLRRKGLKVLQLSIDKLDTEAKYKFFQCLFKVVNHSGVEGYIIKNIKNQIDFSLKPGNGNEWFEGVHLLPLLCQVFCLPDGPETDLLQYLDRVMESLNLLRYLLIRDKVTENQTGIWTELYKIEDKFLQPLRIGVNMSRAHYEMELKNTVENKKSKVKEESVLSVTVDNENLPNMTPESQMQALHSALHTFDMIESVLVRIEEITEGKDNP
ncbi:glomulin, FKBP associated protein a [Lampris incognitus]|uniref:glomulin, FKBP associated protein a n=1 Tax=Lampris incognitus TaxID=2546036 RepID=UPI0024B52221|nr:glomulin, FKBP associated protein a [Lampris incognitus]